MNRTTSTNPNESGAVSYKGNTYRMTPDGPEVWHRTEWLPVSAAPEPVMNILSPAQPSC